MTVTAQATGYRVAPVPDFAVDRPALVDRLESAIRKRVVLVVAPAGYGKSVLLAQWHAAHPDRRVLWMAARPTDDAAQFGRRLVERLEHLVPGAASRALDHIGPDGAALGEDLLAIVLAELADIAPVTVVVEDLETLASPVVLDELGLLAERAADGIGFVFVSRDDRLPRTPRLRLRDEVAEIRQGNLTLTVDESAEAIRRVAGLDLHPVQVQALHARTEGWAAGVQLAALGLRDHSDPDRFVADFAGDDRHVADYLSGEVLAVQRPEVTEFLLRTSVLDRLNGPLCDALTGRADGQRLLERLDQQLLFVRPLDGRRQWFSVHPLFRDLLRYELRATRGAEERVLLERAAAWHLEHGEVDTAAEYLVRAEDWRAVIALARREAGRHFARGEASTVLRWLGEVPADVLLADADAALTKIALHTMCGSTIAAQELLERIEATTPLAEDRHRVLAAAVRASWVFFHVAPDASDAAAEVALELLDRGYEQPEGPLLDILTPAALRALVMVAQAVACWSRADHAGARRLLTAVAEGGGPVLWVVHALGEQAWTEATTGNLRLALTLAHRSLDVAEGVGIDHHQPTAMAHLALARAHLERGESTATGHFETAMARARSNHRTRVTALEWGERAHVALVDGRVGDGLDQIAAARVAGGPPLAPVVRARLAALEIRLHLLAGNPVSARKARADHDGIVTAELLGASAALAAADDDLPMLRKLVDDWPAVDAAEPAARWARGQWTAVLADREGDRRGALVGLRAVVAEAETEGAVRLLLDSGREVLRLLRTLYHDGPTPFLRRLVEVVPPAGQGGSPEIVEQLTERELLVLRYLPSRLSNADIAARLYVSVNTLKTHLKNIYRKLAVGDRGEAIERAEELGLL